ncbi:MAG: hypothetical protein F6K00_06560 [Leptolyngbya sp. SIOISBB]|nr:hypothetical protein [Leptolyngbya sp. SIOISBB]
MTKLNLATGFQRPGSPWIIYRGCAPTPTAKILSSLAGDRILPAYYRIAIRPHHIGPFADSRKPNWHQPGVLPESVHTLVLVNPTHTVRVVLVSLGRHLLKRLDLNQNASRKAPIQRFWLRLPHPQPDACWQIGMIIRVAGDWEMYSPGIKETGFEQLEIWATADDTHRIPLFKRFWQHLRRLKPS